MILTTLDRVYGREVAEQLDLVDGTSVYSLGLNRGVSASFAAMNQGQVEELEQACRRARALARKELIEQACDLGADAVLGLRYTSVEIGKGLAEVLVYGTAVRLTG
jgi:uncharacterized protein YbjQ (UPF0145 family)